MQHSIPKLPLLLGLVLIVAWSGGAQAEFVLFEDYEGLTLGPIDDQGGWQAWHDTSLVTVDPDLASNQVLAGNDRLHRPL